MENGRENTSHKGLYKISYTPTKGNGKKNSMLKVYVTFFHPYSFVLGNFYPSVYTATVQSYINSNNSTVNVKLSSVLTRKVFCWNKTYNEGKTLPPLAI